jgi:hypothetical protein
MDEVILLLYRPVEKRLNQYDLSLVFAANLRRLGRLKRDPTGATALKTNPGFVLRDGLHPLHLAAKLYGAYPWARRSL